MRILKLELEINMEFSITFSACSVFNSEHNEKSASGIIKIGDFEEQFIASLDFWSLSDYRSHWFTALKRFQQGEVTSSLITSLTDPNNTNFITWWPIYKVNKTLHFQNQILFMADLKEPFCLDNPFAHIPERETHTDIGEPISEWSVPIENVIEFINNEFYHDK